MRFDPEGARQVERIRTVRDWEVGETREKTDIVDWHASNRNYAKRVADKGR